MTNLRERLVAHTTEVLDTAREPTLPAVKAGPWRKVWEKVSKLWPFGSSGDTSSARLRELLKELHADITAQVEAEVLFWPDEQTCRISVCHWCWHTSISSGSIACRVEKSDLKLGLIDEGHTHADRHIRPLAIHLPNDEQCKPSHWRPGSGVDQKLCCRLLIQNK